MIAVFTNEIRPLLEAAEKNMRAAFAIALSHYIAAYPVPPPLNIPAMLLVLVYEVLVHLGSDAVALIRWAQARGRRRGSAKGKKRFHTEYALDGRTTTRRTRHIYNDDAGGGFKCVSVSHLVEVCRGAWRSLLGQPPPEGHPKHYPPLLHLPDSELEALLGRARIKFVQTGEFDALLHKPVQKWRAEESTRDSFDKLQGKLQNQQDKIENRLEMQDRNLEALKVAIGTIALKLGADDMEVSRSDLRSSSSAIQIRAAGDCSGYPSTPSVAASPSAPPRHPPRTPSGRSSSTGGGTPTGRGALPSPLDAGFDAIDTNKSGAITEDELMAAIIRPPTSSTRSRATPPRVLSQSPSRAAAVAGGSRRKSANAADLDVVARI